MSRSGYDKGFGGVPQRHAGSFGSARPVALPPPAESAVPDTVAASTGSHLKRGPASIATRGADQHGRSLAGHTGRVGSGFAALGLIAGIVSFVSWGNWAAILVLPILLGLIAMILFWVVATLIDLLRGH